MEDLKWTPDLRQFKEEAVKVINLIELQDKTFPENKGYHQLVPIMAGIKDAYERGKREATPDLTKDIVWMGECDNPNCVEGHCPNVKLLDNRCNRCEGTGTITRQATLEEVVEVVEKLTALLWDESIGHLAKQIMLREALTINGGILKIKESI